MPTLQPYAGNQALPRSAVLEACVNVCLGATVLIGWRCHFKSISSCPLQVGTLLCTLSGLQELRPGGGSGNAQLCRRGRAPIPPDGVQPLNSKGGGLTGTKGFVRAWLKDSIFIKGTEISPSNNCTDISWLPSFAGCVCARARAFRVVTFLHVGTCLVAFCQQDRQIRFWGWIQAEITQDFSELILY